jgi:tetratricopeptide (TPR) repeat protein
MKPNGKRAALLLLACAVGGASAVVGCSKRGESPRAKAEDSKPAAVSGEPVPFKHVDGEGFDEAAAPRTAAPRTAAPKTATSASFADGEAAYHAKNYSDATKIFEQYTSRRPENAWGHYMLGLSAWKSGDVAKSESAFEVALRIDPNHVKSYVNLSRVLIEQKRYDDAIAKLTLASEVDADSIEVPRLMARAYTAQNKIDEAVDAYRRAIVLNESDAWSLNNLGLLFLEQGFVEDAVPYLARAVEINPRVPAFHNNLGMALEHKGRFLGAVEAYKGALAADPRYEKARQNLARVAAVKSGPEEPFDLAALARGVAEERKVAVDATREEK